jgi:hypothetical protein
VAKTIVSRRSLKIEAVYSNANFFSRFKKPCSHGLRLWRYFICFGLKKLGIGRKTQSALCAYQIHFIWIINRLKRLREAKTIFNCIRHEACLVLGCSIEKRLKEWRHFPSIETKITYLYWTIMLPNCLHLVSD